jgi:uncharacterized protein YecT (DUF1311 family)
MRRLSLALAALLIAGLAGAARADPLLECGVMIGDQAAELNACLSAQLKVSSGAMDEALALARARAEALDAAAGGDAAVLGVEASQQAFEAYRDTACRTEAVFVDSDARAESVELGCEIALTRARTDALLRLSVPRPD